jgi:hypothetical protein
LHNVVCPVDRVGTSVEKPTRHRGSNYARERHDQQYEKRNESIIMDA